MTELRDAFFLRIHRKQLQSLKIELIHFIKVVITTDPHSIGCIILYLFNKRYQGKGKVAEVAQGAAQGPSSKLLDAEIRRKGVYELLRMANVPTGHCIQCGIPGHRLKQDACAMKDRKLADKSCIRCGQGLHSPDECTKPIPANIQQLLESSLNGV